MGVKQFLSWVKLISVLPVSERKLWVKQIFDGIASYRKGKKDSDIYLTDLIADASQFKRVGFCSSVSYVKIDGSRSELPAMYVHPWGTPSLLLKHKTLPLCIIVSPSMRMDETIDGRTGVNGLTG